MALLYPGQASSVPGKPGDMLAEWIDEKNRAYKLHRWGLTFPVCADTWRINDLLALKDNVKLS